jgi:hypothetical protein
LFFSIAAGHQKAIKAKEMASVSDLREKVAEYLMQNNGQVKSAEFKDQWFKKGDDGIYVLDGQFQNIRHTKNDKEKAEEKAQPPPQKVVTVDDYARMIVSGGLYGGDLEIAVLADILDATICVYSCFFFDDQTGRFQAEVRGRGANVISLLFQQNFGSKKGGSDHWDLICDKFAKWRQYMRQMPVWNTDIALCIGRGGRGIKALRDIEKGEPITFYDGHRVDEKGKIVIMRAAVKELLDFFSVDPEALDFHKSHAVCLGRVHVTGLMIDGYPLTLPVFDEVVEVMVGRGALANSASLTDSNTKLVWVDAPDLPLDPVNNLICCEAVLVARRRIYAGEEILWHYAIHKQVRIRLANTVHDLDTTASSDSECDMATGNSAAAAVHVQDTTASSDSECDMATGNSAAAAVHVQDTTASSASDSNECDKAAPQSVPVEASNAQRSADSNECDKATANSAAAPQSFPVEASNAQRSATDIGPSNEIVHVDSPRAQGTFALSTRQFVAADESEDSCVGEHSHGPGEDVKVNDRVVVKVPGSLKSVGTVTGRIVTHNQRHVQKYVVELDGQSQPRVVLSNHLRLHWEDLDSEEDVSQSNAAAAEGNGNGTSDEGGDDLKDGGNESGMLANELMGRVTCLDVAKLTANEIWDQILSVRELRGGMLLRSILIAAASDQQCLPLWPHGTAQEKRVNEKKLQGIDFVKHFSPPKKLDWLRVKLFSVVSGNRNTYQKLRVTYNGCTSLTLSSASNGIELTTALRCRIACLALDADCVQLLLVIFGSKSDSLEKQDNRQLKEPSLWQQLAKDYVNNKLWQPYWNTADCIPECYGIDTSVAPPSPGLDHTIVQDVFLDCRSDWTRLKTRVFGVSGCNSTGNQLLKSVWSSYVNFKKGHFIHKEVAMFVFASWLSVGKDLPELCNRMLPARQQLVIGVTPGAAGSASNQSDAHTTLMSPISSGSSVTPKGRSRNTSASGSSSSETLQLIASMATVCVIFLTSLTILHLLHSGNTRHSNANVKRARCPIESWWS